MKGLAFVKDPDGYLVEILPQGPMISKPVDHAACDRCEFLTGSVVRVALEHRDPCIARLADRDLDRQLAEQRNSELGGKLLSRARTEDRIACAAP